MTSINTHCFSLPCTKHSGLIFLHPRITLKNGYTTLSRRRLPFGHYKHVVGARVAINPGEAVPGQDNLAITAQAGLSNHGINLQPDALAFATLSGDMNMTPTTSSYLARVGDEYDSDYPTEGFSSIPDAIDDIQKGKF